MQPSHDAPGDTHDSSPDAGPTRAATGPDTSHPDVLTVAQAALLLDVSPRSIQRRCQKGTLRARRVEGEFGEEWEINRADVEQATTRAATHPRQQPRHDDDTPATKSHDEATTQVRHPSDKATTTPRPVAPVSHPQSEVEPAPVPTSSEQSAPNYATRYMEQLERENAFLRAAVEQHQRSEAELRAALREALRAMPRQLPANTPETAPAAPEQVHPANTLPTPKAAPEAAQNVKAGATPTKEPRPLWKVILGIR